MYIIIGAIIAGIVGFPELAHAMDTDYTVYNGFQPIFNSFQRLALITSDPGFKSLYAVGIVVSIFAAGAMNAVKALNGKSSGLAWAMPVLAGITVYMAMFSGTGTIHLYDPVLNKTGDIGGVPVGIIAMARVTNSIEVGFIDMISTAGVPGGYDSNAGGIGFSMLSNTGHMQASDPDATSSLGNFVTDCVLFEISRPGTTLTWNEMATTTDLWGTTLAKAQNPAVFTQSALLGDSVTCTASFNSLKGYYTNPANMAAMKADMCSKAGFDTTAVGLVQCSASFTSTTTLVAGSADSPETYLAGSEVSSMFMDAVKSASPMQASALLANQSQTSGVMSGFSFAAQAPYYKAVYTAAMFAFLPVIIIFVPTVKCGAAMSAIFGIFIMLTSWSIADATLNGIMMDYAVGYFQGVAASGKSLYYYMSFPNNATMTMSQFGYMRPMAMLLAGMVTAILTKSASALISGTGTALRDIKNKNEQGATTMTTSGGKGATLNGMLAGHAGLSNFAHHNSSDLMHAAEWGGEKIHGAKGFEETMAARAAAGGNAGMYGDMALKNESQKLAEAGQKTVAQAQLMGQVSGASAVSTLKALEQNPGGAVQTAQNNAYIKQKKDTAGNEQYSGMVDGYMKDMKMDMNDPKQRAAAFGQFAALDMANNKATMKAWNGDVAGYSKFLEGTQHLSQGDRDAVTHAADAAGLDLRDFAGQAGLVDNMKKAGIIQAIEDDKLTEGDLRAMGEAGILSEAGKMDAWKHLQDVKGMDPRQATEFMDTHKNLDTVAKMENFDASSKLMGDMAGKGDWAGMAKAYGQQDGMQERILSKNEAAKLNDQMHKHGQKNFNAKAGDRAQFGYDASTGTLGMAISSGGAKSDYYNLDSKTSGKDWQKIDRDTSVIDKGIRSKIGDDFWSGLKKVHENTDVNIIDKGLRSKVGDQEWSGYSKVDEQTNIRTSKDYVQVDHVLDQKKDAVLMREMQAQLDKQGSKQQIQAGMHYVATYGKDGKVSAWSIEEGGTQRTMDLKTSESGDITKRQEHVKESNSGSKVTGTGTAGIEKAMKFFGASEQTADMASGLAASGHDAASGIAVWTGMGKSFTGERRRGLEKTENEAKRLEEKTASEVKRQEEKAANEAKRVEEKVADKAERAREKAADEAKRAIERTRQNSHSATTRVQQNQARTSPLPKPHAKVSPNVKTATRPAPKPQQAAAPQSAPHPAGSGSSTARPAAQHSPNMPQMEWPGGTSAPQQARPAPGTNPGRSGNPSPVGKSKMPQTGGKKTPPGRGLK